jgi:ceramide glucosyltransferase
MIALACAMAALAFLMVHLGTIRLYLRRLRPADRSSERSASGPNVRPVGAIGTPFVTLLRPVCGIDPWDAETLRSSFRQDYPHYEIIFCAQSPQDPVIGLVRRLIAEHPDVPARLLVGHDPVTGNPKLNNVWKGWHAAGSDWICMTDSNLLLPPHYLSTVVSTWQADTGLVSAPPIGTRPLNMAGRLECAFLNGNQAVLQYAADSLGAGFAQGKTLFFHKPLLESAGGLAALGTSLAEDAAATRLIRRLGRRVNLTPLPFAQPIGERSFKTVWARQLRWSRVRRDAFPLLFVCEIMNGGLVPIALASTAAHLAGVSPLAAIGYALLWYAAEAGLSRRAGWARGWGSLALPVLRDAMLPAIWLATYARRGFEWRGTSLERQAPDQAAPVA